MPAARSPSARAHRPHGPPGPTDVAVVDLGVCDRCGLCLPLCPPEAIHLLGPDLLVDRDTCTGCWKCIAPCPVGALSMIALVPGAAGAAA